jgi:hypothetical protein
MKIASPKLETSQLAPNDQAASSCKVALERRDSGDYEGAQEVMRPLWRGVGDRPETAGLHHLLLPKFCIVLVF